MATMKPTLCGERAVHAPDCGEDGNCEYYAERAEAWAVGTVGGDPVPSYDLAYENNSKYWAEQSAASASESAESATESTESATQAKGYAETAEQAAEEATNALGQVMSKTTGIFTQTFTTSTDTDTLTFNPTGYTYSANDDFDVYISGLRLNPTEFSWTGSGSSATITLVTPVTHTGTVIEVVANTSSQMTTDATLTVQGAAADAKATGDEINQLKEDLTAIAIRPTVSGSIASFNDGAEDVPMKSLVVNIEPLQSGSGDPSPSNVRPISGWAEVETTRCGVNIWDEDWEEGYINAATGENQTYPGRVRSKGYIRCAPDEKYYFHFSTYQSWLSLSYYDENKMFIRTVTPSSNTVITTDSSASYMRFATNDLYGGTYKNDISINCPSTDTAYHEYTGEEYTTALGQTVYGGKLDVVTGELVIDRAMVDLGTLTWGDYSAENHRFGALINDTNAEDSATARTYEMCSCYKPVENGPSALTDGQCRLYAGGNYRTLYICDNRFSSSNGIATTLSGQKFMYKLATPTTIQLTPQEVTTLLGVNNIFADAGSVDVTYLADGKLYIDNRIAELQALILEQ